MSNLEHYFENLLFDGHDVNGNINKNQLTPEQIEAVEICASYVKYTMFNSDEELHSFLSEDSYEPVRHGHWNNYKDEHRCSVCDEVVIVNPDNWNNNEEVLYDYCPYCGAKMDKEKE